MTIVLPWPSRDLSPNSRCHWSVKAKAVKSARLAAGWAVKTSDYHRIDGDGKINVHITFHPPSKRRYDLDNCLASMKSALDGIADGLNVNDSRFRLHLEMGEVIKGGRVFIRIESSENEK